MIWIKNENKRKQILILSALVAVTFLTVFSFALSTVTFYAPTLPSSSFINKNWVETNLTISNMSDLDTFKMNWNNTNYSIYDSSLVLAMNFNNNSAIGENATKAVDISNYGNNGTINGSTWTSSGKYGGAMQFDGVNDYIDAGNGASLNITNNITIEAWVKGNEQINRGILTKYNNGVNQRSWMISTRQTTANKLRVLFSDDGTSNAGHLRDYETSVNVFNNTWNHIAVTFSSGTENIYVNGVLDTAVNKITDAAITSLYNTPVNVLIGAHFTNGVVVNYFNGSIDEVRIYNRALSAEEIAMQYQSEFKKYNATDYGFYVNVTNQIDGAYTYSGWANDTAGLSASSEVRTVNIDATIPTISYIAPTDANNSNIPRNWTLVNTTVSDANNMTALIDFDRSLVGWWRFNNATDFKDYSTYTNDGTNYGSTYTDSGRFGGARSFDGVNDYVNAGTLGSFGSKLNLPFSVSLWIMSNQYTTITSVLGTINSDSTQIIQLKINTNSANGLLSGSLRFRIGDPSGHNLIFGTDAATVMPSSGWKHLTITVNPASTTGNIYINGINQSIVYNLRQVTTAFNNFSYPFLIGAVNSATPSQFFNGSIDDVRIYNRALSPEEINASFNAGSYRLYHNFTGLTDGVHNYTAYVQDAAGNVNSTTRTVNIDTAPPTAVTLLTPTDGDHTNTNQTAFDWTDATDANGVDKYQLQIANNSGFADANIVRNITGISTSAYTLTSAQALSDGTYYWRARANDTIGNGYTAWGIAGNFSVIIDTINPDWILGNYPKSDNSTVVDGSITWDAKVYDNNLFRILMNVTNSTGYSFYSNYTADWNVSWFNFTNTVDTSAWAEGNYTVELSATDDHTDTVTDLKKGKKGETLLIFNSTTSETKISAFFIDKTDTIMAMPVQFNSTISDMTAQGYYKFGFNFTTEAKDNIKLVLNITSDKPITYRTPQSGYKGHFVWDNYYIDFADVPSTINLTVKKISDYQYQVKMQGVTAWGKYQNIVIDPVTGGLNTQTEYYRISVDRTAPFVSISSPANTTYAKTTLDLNYTATDANLNTVWYNYNGINITLSGNTSITAIEGTSILTLYANDSLNRINTTSVTFIIDTISPTVMILSPLNQTYSTNSIWFNISVSETTSWCGYSLDGTDNATISGLSVQNTSMSELGHNIQFWCNDTIGNIGNTSIQYFSILTDATICANLNTYQCQYLKDGEETYQCLHEGNCSQWDFSNAFFKRIIIILKVLKLYETT